MFKCYEEDQGKEVHIYWRNFLEGLKENGV